MIFFCFCEFVEIVFPSAAAADAADASVAVHLSSSASFASCLTASALASAATPVAFFVFLLVPPL